MADRGSSGWPQRTLSAADQDVCGNHFVGGRWNSWAVEVVGAWR